MKSLSQFLLEAIGNFQLDDHERQALATFLGIFLGELGEDNERESYKDIKLSDSELEQLKDLYYCLDDKQTYKYINRSIIKDDIQLLVKLYNELNDKDLLGENWDLIDAFEKIAGV